MPNVCGTKDADTFDSKARDLRSAINFYTVPCTFRRGRLVANSIEPAKRDELVEIGDNLATTGDSYVSIFVGWRTRRYKISEELYSRVVPRIFGGGAKTANWKVQAGTSRFVSKVALWRNVKR